MSPFSSGLRFWSARGTDVIPTYGGPRREGVGRVVLSWHSPGCRAGAHLARATSNLLKAQQLLKARVAHDIFFYSITVKPRKIP